MEKTIEIVGIPINNVTAVEALAQIDRVISSNTQAHWVTVNPEMALHASKDPSFLGLLRKVDLRTPDGIGILWAAHYLQAHRPASAIVSRFQWLQSLASVLLLPHRVRNPLRERVTGTDLMAMIAEASWDRGWTLFLLGASNGVAERAIENLSKAHPGAKFVGSYSGSPSVSDDAEAVRRIELAKPTILFVAYGSPAQEEWIQRNLARLPSVHLAIGVGGAFDFHAGMARRAPRWMQKMGLEWLWRLCREPRRLGRIWNAVFAFPQLIYKEKGLRR